MTYRTEFPDFRPEDMPAMPERGNWIDTSWHNNAMPSITSDALGLHVWIDYSDPTLREFPDWPGRRFVVERQHDGIEIGDVVLETDEWAEVLKIIENIP